jgi:ketosteroid isomerase-like protein
MVDRSAVEGLLRNLYGARVRGDLDALCNCFGADAILQIAGASDAKPIAITAQGAVEVRRLLAMMVKTFKLNDYASLALLVDGARAAAHWRARIHSRITGSVVSNEFMDLIEIRDGRVAAYSEFFVPR